MKKIVVMLPNKLFNFKSVVWCPLFRIDIYKALLSSDKNKVPSKTQTHQ